MNIKIALSKLKGKVKKNKEFACSVEYWARVQKHELDKILASLESVEKNMEKKEKTGD